MSVSLYEGLDFEPLDNHPESELYALREFLSTYKRQGVSWPWARTKALERFPNAGGARESAAWGEESPHDFLWRHLGSAYKNRRALRYCTEVGCVRLTDRGPCFEHAPAFCACGNKMQYRSKRCADCRREQKWSPNPVWLEGVREGPKFTELLLEEARLLHRTGLSLPQVAARLFARSDYPSVSAFRVALDRQFRKRGWGRSHDEAMRLRDERPAA